MEDILKLMRQRHSVRQYTDKVIEENKREVLNTLIKDINTKHNLHIQIFYDEPKCFDSFMAHYGKFTGVKNYISLVGCKSDTLEENLGYFGEEIVLKAQELGLNSCWVAMTHGKSKATINKGEKEVCLIALGYGETSGFDHKVKDAGEVSNISGDSPKWFVDGVNASLLAPTAMNQQKYFITLNKDNSVSFKALSGFYTKLDLGIIKYHFEVVSNLSH